MMTALSGEHYLYHRYGCIEVTLYIGYLVLRNPSFFVVTLNTSYSKRVE